MLAALYDLFKKLKLSDIPYSKPSVITIPANSTNEQALELLRTHEINGAPVLNEQGMVKGFVDFRDIACYVLSKSASDYAAALGDPVGNSMEFSERDPMVLISESTNASMAIRVFAEGVPRVPITRADGTIHGVLTQSDLLRQLLTHSTKNKAAMEALAQSISSYKVIQKTVISVKEDTPAFECLRHLQSLTAVPVVDASGSLIGFADAVCLRSFSAANMSELTKPIRQYLQQYHPKALHPLTVMESTSLSECVEVLSRKGNHRAWIVDGHKRPIGVVSATDVFGVISKGLMAAARAD